MFRITEDPSSGSIVQCLVKNYKNDSIVSVDMDVVLRCVVHCIGSAFLYSELHTTHNVSEYGDITPTLSMSTDTIEPFL